MGVLLRLLLVLMLALTGCTTVEVARGQGDRGASRTFLGVVRMVTPDRQGQLSAVDAQGLGLGWDRGPWLGWRSGSWIEADPARCQLLIVIRSPAQAENAAKVIEALGGEEACIADYTGSLRR